MPSPLTSDEFTMVSDFLDEHRDALQRKCSGLTDEQLRLRSVPPSSMSLMGIMRHMFEVERWWFRHYVDGQVYESLLWAEDNPDGDFDDIDEVTGAETLEMWREECDHSRFVIHGVESLDQLAAFERNDSAVSVRWIMMHMIQEYARHNGHADLIRERIDGVTGE